MAEQYPGGTINEAAPKRNTVLVGEKVGEILSRLRAVNEEAADAVGYLSGSNCAVGGQSAKSDDTLNAGFMNELIDALGKVEHQVAVLEDMIRRLNSI